MCNQVIWTTSCKVMAKILQYISIYFRKSWMTLDDHKVHKKQKMFREWYAWDYSWPSESMGEPPQKYFFQKMWFFGDFRSVILVNKYLKNHIFWKKHLFGGVPAFTTEATSSPMHIVHKTILVFDVPCGNPKSSSKSTFTDVSMFFVALSYRLTSSTL